MVEIKRDCAVYGAQRERLVFDLMKKFPIGPGNMSVILTMEEAAATITVMDEEIARLTAELEAEKAKRVEAVDAETRACADLMKQWWDDNFAEDEPHERLLARLDQRKEAGE